MTMIYYKNLSEDFYNPIDLNQWYSFLIRSSNSFNHKAIPNDDQNQKEVLDLIRYCDEFQKQIDQFHNICTGRWLLIIDAPTWGSVHSVQLIEEVRKIAISWFSIILIENEPDAVLFKALFPKISLMDRDQHSWMIYDLFDHNGRKEDSHIPMIYDPTPRPLHIPKDPL